MNIEALLREFNDTHKRYDDKIPDVLFGKSRYSLKRQQEYYESDFLPENIRASVSANTVNKGTAIRVYKELIKFLREKGVDVEVKFPPVDITSSFDRRIFIAKYLQNAEASISDLEDILWVSSRTIEDDIGCLRGRGDDAIAVNGRKFVITDTNRSNGRLYFASTAHPIFLTENLTQVIVMLKGLKTMAENPLYTRYAEVSASNIWNQLSDYATGRLRSFLGKYMPEDLEWIEALPAGEENSFQTEARIGRADTSGPNVIFYSMKSENTFCVEYDRDGTSEFYKDCRVIKLCSDDDSEKIEVECDGERITLEIDRVIRSAYKIDELL